MNSMNWGKVKIIKRCSIKFVTHLISNTMIFMSTMIGKTWNFLVDRVILSKGWLSYCIQITEKSNLRLTMTGKDYNYFHSQGRQGGLILLAMQLMIYECIIILVSWDFLHVRKVVIQVISLYVVVCVSFRIYLMNVQSIERPRVYLQWQWVKLEVLGKHNPIVLWCILFHLEDIAYLISFLGTMPVDSPLVFNSP